MEQKDYTMEIVNELLKGRCHIRKIAGKLGTNHMNVLRKLKRLSRENVVDYEEEGKNKNYFLKKSEEAKAYVFMAENYKQVQTLKKYPSLRGIFERIQKNSRIKLALLFGSFAKGTAKPESDIDIFIETDKKDVKKDLEIADTRLSIKTGRYDKSSLLIREIGKNHVVIKGVEEYYEKNGLFGQTEAGGKA